MVRKRRPAGRLFYSGLSFGGPGKGLAGNVSDRPAERIFPHRHGGQHAIPKHAGPPQRALAVRLPGSDGQHGPGRNGPASRGTLDGLGYGRLDRGGQVRQAQRSESRLLPHFLHPALVSKRVSATLIATSWGLFDQKMEKSRQPTGRYPPRTMRRPDAGGVDFSVDADASGFSPSARKVSRQRVMT